MFQYTTETIINSNVGRLPGGKRFGLVRLSDPEPVDMTDSTAVNAVTNDDFLVIDGVNTFKIEYVKRIYETAYRDSQNEVASFTFPTVAANTVVRVAISLREVGSVRASMQDAYLYHRKPFFYELVATGTPADDAAALVKLINKDMREKDEKYFKAEIGLSNNKVVLTAMDCYIRFIVDKFNVASVPSASPATNLGGMLLGFEDYDDLNVVLSIDVPGDEGQGTVTRLVKNLRIPTGASINPFAADQGGKPIPGGEYTQFLIEYETPRAHVSGTVVGSVGEVSRTSHVFFIEDAIKSDFEAVLARVATLANTGGIKAAGRGDASGTGKGANVSTVGAINTASPIAADLSAEEKSSTDAALEAKTEMGSVE